MHSHNPEWDQALARFQRWQVSANISDRTISNREEMLRHLGRFTGKGPSTVMLEDLEDFMARPHPRTGKRLAQGTLQSTRSYLQCFFRWYKRMGGRRDNPAKSIPKTKMARRLPRPLRIDQVNSMIDSGAYRRTRDIIMIAALTGLRIGEVVRIRGEDVDLVGMVLTTLRKGRLEHRIAITPALLELVLLYPRSGWWFPSRYANKEFPNGGGHILMRSASDAVGKAMRRAGITDRRLTGHSLRHYCATEMLRNGVPIRVVQEHLGHASLATTQLYAGVTDEDLQDGVAVMPAIELREHANRRRRRAVEPVAA